MRSSKTALNIGRSWAFTAVSSRRFSSKRSRILADPESTRKAARIAVKPPAGDGAGAKPICLPASAFRLPVAKLKRKFQCV